MFFNNVLFTERAATVKVKQWWEELLISTSKWRTFYAQKRVWWQYMTFKQYTKIPYIYVHGIHLLSMFMYICFDIICAQSSQWISYCWPTSLDHYSWIHYYSRPSSCWHCLSRLPTRDPVDPRNLFRSSRSSTLPMNQRLRITTALLTSYVSPSRPMALGK